MDRLKRNYLNARRLNSNKSIYTFEQIHAMCMMVKYGIVPDNRFGKEECRLWDMMHSLQNTSQEKEKE